MGCFSFMCKECGKPILSDSFSGEPVKLFLLEKGEVIEMMESQYDSYGRVFDDNMDSREWALPWSDMDEGVNVGDKTVCGLMSDKTYNSGMAAVHSGCYTGKIPITPSEGDPNQGWGTPDDYGD